MEAIKTVILPGLSPGFQAVSHQIVIRPARILKSPKNRICPSRSVSSCVNIRRHPSGEANGKRPSITSTKASASQMVSLLKVYFLGVAAGDEPPRITLKNSLEAGSSTITSLLPLKLALYASRLR